jgi:hypothetical protein
VYTWTGAPQRAAKPPEPSAYDQGKAAYESKQYDQARTLFTQACDGGNLNACNYLGFIYANGQGIPPDAKTAQEIYQKACDQGNLLSCTSLGSMFQDSGNKSEARKYFQEACDGKVAEACELLRGVR